MRDQSLPALRIERCGRIASRVAGSREDRRELVRSARERPRRQRRVEVRQAEDARVHVERDVQPAVARASRRARSQRRLSSIPFRGTRCETCSRTLGARRRCGSPRRPRRAAPVVAAPRVRRVERRRRAPQSAVSSSSVAPAPARTRDRSSSPRRPRRATRAAAPASRASSRASAGRSARPTRREPQLAVRHEAEHVDRRPRAVERARSTRRPSSTSTGTSSQ